MDDVKTQLAEKLKSVANILVTVSSNPSVDQLAACIGMTLWLNKLNKHATAVFSGEIPNALEFLQPEATIEKNTNSLRDFIIALDKSKADKLRYKVEDRVVKIFITPYRTSLSADDLEFSQGDFNVEAIVAIGVTNQNDLDTAITAHGRILHDATVITINTGAEGDIGSLNWHDTTASSLSELVYDLCQELGSNQLDPQIATALLTGIVAETNRFSNNKTTPNTMSVSAALMAAGANQQLVANKLEEATIVPGPVKANPVEGKAEQEADANGTLEIEHNADQAETPAEEVDSIQEDEPAKDETTNTDIKEGEGEQPDSNIEPKNSVTTKQRMITESPQFGGVLTANSRPDDDMDATSDPLTRDKAVNPLTLPPVDAGPLPELDEPVQSEPPVAETAELPIAETAELPDTQTESLPPDMPQMQPSAGPAISDQKQADIDSNQTLSQIEEEVDSPHLDDLRDQIKDALTEPIQAEPEEKGVEFNPQNFDVQEVDVPDSTPAPEAPPTVPPPLLDPTQLPPEPPAQ